MPLSEAALRQRAGLFATCLRHLLVVAGLGLAGCNSLPAIVPDLATAPRQSIQLHGAHGPLPAAQSKAILDKLGRHGPETGIFDRHLAREEAIVGSPLTTGNRVRLLQNGPATYGAMLAAIAHATDHINMETYILEDDEVGQRFAKALMDKQRQGVQVNLIRDSVGTRTTSAAFFQTLKDAGVKVLEFNPINPLQARKDWELNQRDHRKLLIVDGRIAFLGGINISGVYASGSAGHGGSSGRKEDDQRKQSDAERLAWRDTDLQLEGPVVAELQKLFLAAWSGQKGDPLVAKNYFPSLQSAGHEVVRAIGSSPDEARSLIYATLLSAIDSAQTSVEMTNAYFAPDPQLLATLEKAAARGVDVRLILPSKTDSWLVFHAGRGYYEQLLRAGVKIYERRGVILHSKTVLIDGVWATVGSTNLDWRSFVHNHELNAVVLGADFGEQVQRMFEKDLAQSDEITLAQWQKRPIKDRLMEYLARMWAYWL